MAEKNEKNYTIPLRKKVLKKARWKRAKRAVSDVRNYIKKHMKSENVKLDSEISEQIWKFGGKKVPSKIRITAKKEEDVVKVRMTDSSVKKTKETENSKEKKKDKKQVKTKPKRMK